ncbi:MAG: ion transporter [Coriobacteriia bacterium]|nr:ion transporter [Coriobacteriia bacterium]
MGLFLLIILSVASVVFETVPSLAARYSRAFWAFDVFTVIVFTIEYVWRLWACTADPRYASPVAGRVRYAFSTFGIIDLASILPFYVGLALPASQLDLRFLRVLRLMRFARVLKLGRYSEAVDRLKSVFRARAADLLVALLSILVVLVLASSVVYHVENTAQPDKFTSIPAAMWWGISALTTVGYGDIMPVTTLGKLIGGCIQLLGIALFALPAAILAAGYEDDARKRRALKGVCPTCGRSDASHEQGIERTSDAVSQRHRAERQGIESARTASGACSCLTR